MWWQLTKPRGVLSSKKRSNDAGVELAAERRCGQTSRRRGHEGTSISSHLRYRSRDRRALPPGRGTRGRGDRLERLRRQCARRCAANTSAPVRAYGDGAWRDLRRGERDRSKPPTVPRATGGAAVGLDGRSGRDGGVPRPRRDRPGPAAHARTVVHGVARRGSRRAVEGRRNRGRRNRGGRDDRGTDGRRPIRLVQVHARPQPGGVAAGASTLRQRPVRLGRIRETLPDRERVAVPFRRSERTDERRVRRGLR